MQNRFRNGLLGLGFAVGMLAGAPDAGAQDPAQIAAGEEVFNANCAVCHGLGLEPKIGIPDLRKLAASRRAYFGTSVLKGRAPEMPAWEGFVTEEQVEQLWVYIQANK